MVFRYLVLLLALSAGLRAAQPTPQTTAAFDRYVKLTEERFAKPPGYEKFLWLDGNPKQKTLTWLGQSVVLPLQTLDNGKEIEVPDGEIQHWLGVVYLEHTLATSDNVRGLFLNFPVYKDFFGGQIKESKLIKRQGDVFDFSLRFYKKQISTVVLNVNETGDYVQIDPLRWFLYCRSTKIGEAEHPKDKKKLDIDRSPEEAAGYLWRFNFYLRVQQSDNGVYVELETISLSRPSGGLLDKSRYLSGFQSFPHELIQAVIDRLEIIFPHRH